MPVLAHYPSEAWVPPPVLAKPGARVDFRVVVCPVSSSLVSVVSEADTVALIRRLAADNPLWGAERIRGELGKLGLRVAKRTIQTYLRATAGPRPRGQAWATFLRNHAHEIWACDFLPVTDLLFRPLC